MAIKNLNPNASKLIKASDHIFKARLAIAQADMMNDEELLNIYMSLKNFEEQLDTITQNLIDP